MTTVARSSRFAQGMDFMMPSLTLLRDAPE